MYQLKLEKKISNSSHTSRDLNIRRYATANVQRGNGNPINKLINGRRRIVKLLIVLVVLFLISRLPYHVISLTIDILLYLEQNFALGSTSGVSSNINKINSYKDESQIQFISTYIYPFGLFLALTNSATNPLCYLVLNHEFKNMFKCRLFNCC